MEMHQVRYFLATVSELNFTKAAEKSNVAAVADSGHQAARGRAGRRPISARAAPSTADRARPTYVSPAQAMLRERPRREVARFCHQERRSRDAQARIVANDQSGAADAASGRAQPAVQPPGGQIAARDRAGDCQASQVWGGRARYRRGPG